RKGERKKNRSEHEQRENRGPNFAPGGAGDKSGAHPFERVSDRYQPGNHLQGARQYRDRVHHYTEQARKTEHDPLRGVSAFEENLIARRKNSEPAKSQDRSKQDDYGRGPVGCPGRETEKESAPREIDTGSKSERAKRIQRGAREDHLKGRLSDEERFESTI